MRMKSFFGLTFIRYARNDNKIENFGSTSIKNMALNRTAKIKLQSTLPEGVETFILIKFLNWTNANLRYYILLEAQVSLYRSPDLSPFSVKKCLHDESSAEIDSYKES